MAINAKLLKFQQLNLVIKKDSANPAFKGSKYASLPEILETVIPKLTELKLVVVNTVQDGTIVTELIDTEDDTKVSANFPLFGTKPQEFGSSITYGRRYNLGALLNLQIDDDDDGNAANSAQRTTTYNQEEVMWYNDTDKNIKKWGEMVRNGDITPEAIIKKIESEGFRLANKHKQSIQSLGEKDLTNPPF